LNNKAERIPETEPTRSPDNDTFLNCREGKIVISIIDEAIYISIPLFVTISQVNIPKRTPENPIEHGILSVILCKVVSNTVFTHNRNITREKNFLGPRDSSTLERAYRTYKLENKCILSICTKLLKKLSIIFLPQGIDLITLVV